MIPWFQGQGGSPPEFVLTAFETQKVNRLLLGLGCPGISPWEYDQLPEDDLKDLVAYVNYERQFAGIAQRKKERETKQDKING